MAHVTFATLCPHSSPTGPGTDPPRGLPFDRCSLVLPCVGQSRGAIKEVGPDEWLRVLDQDPVEAPTTSAPRRGSQQGPFCSELRTSSSRYLLVRWQIRHCRLLDRSRRRQRFPRSPPRLRRSQLERLPQSRQPCTRRLDRSRPLRMGWHLAQPGPRMRRLRTYPGGRTRLTVPNRSWRPATLPRRADTYPWPRRRPPTRRTRRCSVDRPHLRSSPDHSDRWGKPRRTAQADRTRTTRADKPCPFPARYTPRPPLRRGSPNRSHNLRRRPDRSKTRPRNNPTHNPLRRRTRPLPVTQGLSHRRLHELY